jgi:RecA/RadA recombinase
MAVEGWLADKLNQERGEIYAFLLPDLSPAGLAEVDDPDREIKTEARGELESLVGRMPGGSIGIAGPRGAGKTTLIHRLTTWVAAGGESAPARGIVVDAPVDYDAREFVLHVLASLCESVIGRDRVDALRSWGQGAPGGSWRTFLRSFRGPFSPKLGAFLLIVGLALYVAAIDARGELHLSPESLSLYGLIVAGVGLSVIYLAFTLNARAVLRWLRPRLRIRMPKGDPVAIAEIHLRQIWFQRSFTSGWSGGLKLPMGVEASAEASAQLAENQLSFPDIIALYKEFVELLASEKQVRIGIDELDKMEDERARRFLNEIKALFRIDNCFYFVSVSEDAMAYFERRGLPFREVFDSSFDDVLRVGYLRYEASRRLLHRRVVGLPAQFISLGHALGGGLARDVIRAARAICEQPTGKPLIKITEALCSKELASKCSAARVGVRRLEDPQHVMLLSQWLTQVEISANPTELLQRCHGFGREFISPLGDEPDGDGKALEHFRETFAIAFEIVTFAYFLATLQELMSTLDTQEATESAIQQGAVDGLAVARQAFAINAPEAWVAISRVRTSHLRREAVDLPLL